MKNFKSPQYVVVKSSKNEAGKVENLNGGRLRIFTLQGLRFK